MMRGARLTLNCKDGKGAPDGTLLKFEMKFVQALTSIRSLFRFRFELVNQAGGLGFLMTSDDAADIFRYFEDVYYGSTAVAPITVSTASETGSDADALQVQIDKTCFTGTNQFAVELFSFKLTPAKGAPMSFMLTNTDASGMYLFMNSMLWSNPPNPEN
jgi:hypothetical protein